MTESHEIRIKYYSSQGIKIMNAIEAETKIILCDSEHKKLEADFWAAEQAGNTQKLAYYYNELCKVLDEIRSKN